MATLQLGFYPLAELALREDGPGLAADPGLQGLTLPASPHPATAPLRVIEDRVAPDSPFGLPGQPVQLTGRITLRPEGPQPREIAFDILAVGGTEVGLVGPALLAPGLGHRVTGLDPAAGGALARHARPAPLGPISDGAPPPPAPPPSFAFAEGTRIDTPDGPRPVETLAPGDLVSTLGSGSQVLRWVGVQPVSAKAMRADPRACPVRFAPGTIGNSRPLLVAPGHRILLSDWRAQVYFGEDQILVPARALRSGTRILQVIPDRGVTLHHLLFDRHEVILAEGALCESFHPGPGGLAALDPADQAAIGALFPGAPVENRRAAFPVVAPSEAAALRLPG
jgi:hypothetical protein